MQAWKVKIELRFIKHKAQELGAKIQPRIFKRYYDEVLPDVEIIDICIQEKLYLSIMQIKKGQNIVRNYNFNFLS